MKVALALILCCISLLSCQTNCNEDLLVGERVEIPIDLSNYSESEASGLFTWTVSDGDTIEQLLRTILINQDFQNPRITDQNPDGYYSSNLNGSNLYFFELNSEKEQIVKDSITDIVIEKSQGNVDDPCYKDDPNVQIDVLSYVHNGEQKGRNDILIIKR